jgi:hypothetical protein
VFVDCSDADEKRVKQETGATIRCFPFKQPQGTKTCLMNGGKPAEEVCDFHSYRVLSPIRRSNGLIWERAFTHGKLCHGFQFFLVLVVFIKRLTKAMHHVILP